MYDVIKHTQMVTNATTKRYLLSVPIYSLQMVNLSFSWVHGYEEKGFQRVEEIKLRHRHCTKSAPPPIMANAHTYASHTI